MSDKLPALHFYPGDWKKDPGVQALTLEERGLWLELLFLMHESSERGVLLLNGKPYPEEILSRIFNLPHDYFLILLKKLLDFGVIHQRKNGAFYSKRMVKDEEVRNIRKLSGSKGGKSTGILLKQISSKQPAKVQENTEDVIEDENEDLDKNKIVPGKTKISEYVHLSDLEREDVLLEFRRFGLEEKHMIRACAHIDKHFAMPENASKRRFAALHLKTWGLQQVMKDQQVKNDLTASENRRKGIKANSDPPRPRSKSVDEVMKEQLGK